MLLGPSLTSHTPAPLGNNVTDRQRIRYSNPARQTQPTDPLQNQTDTSHRPTTSGCPYLGSHESTTPYNKQTDRRWTEGSIFNCMYWCNDQRCVSPRLEGKNSTALPFLPFYCLTFFLPFYRFYHFTVFTILLSLLFYTLLVQNPLHFTLHKKLSYILYSLHILNHDPTIALTIPKGPNMVI